MAKGSVEILERLAAELGESLYIDIAKWHLYLNDAHLHQELAERLFPLVSAGRLDEAQVFGVLRDFKVKVGGGRAEIPLLDLMPSACQSGLIDLLEAFQRQL